MYIILYIILLWQESGVLYMLQYRTTVKPTDEEMAAFHT